MREGRTGGQQLAFRKRGTPRNMMEVEKGQSALLGGVSSTGSGFEACQRRRVFEKNGGHKNLAGVWRAGFVLIMMTVVANLFGAARDDEALRLAQKLTLKELVDFEEASLAVRQGLERANFWETVFKANHPLTYERLKASVARRKNAERLLKEIRVGGLLQSTNVWRGLFILDLDYADRERAVWKRLDPGSECSINVADEFGVDQIPILDIKARQLRSISSIADSSSERVFNLDHRSLKSCVPVRAWSVPFQQAVLILWRGDDGLELVMHNQASMNGKNLNLWALNHNRGEIDDDFVAPGKLEGDYTLYRAPIVASTEARLGLPGDLLISCFAVTIRKRDTLVFDTGLSRHRMEALHWRHLLTHEVHEARNIPVTASCFLLDSLLLFASEDGYLRAHPRKNPESLYHAEHLGQVVTQMTSLYNVVAVILPDTYTLEVRAVTRIESEPFIQFRVVFRESNIDPQHCPLLYGGSVVFATLKGEWKQVRYDSPFGLSFDIVSSMNWVSDGKDWRLASIKNANWRYWNVAKTKGRS